MNNNITTAVTKSAFPYAHIIKSNKWLSENEISRLQNISLLTDTLYNSHNFEITLENFEQEFSTPIDLYRSLSEFINSEYSEPRSGKWEVNAVRLLEFVKTGFPGRVDYFSDCLRFDWCRMTKLNYYPGIFRSEKTKKVKKEGCKFFLEKTVNNRIIFEGIEFSKSEMKNSIFFNSEKLLTRS